MGASFDFSTHGGRRKRYKFAGDQPTDEELAAVAEDSGGSLDELRAGFGAPVDVYEKPILPPARKQVFDLNSFATTDPNTKRTSFLWRPPEGKTRRFTFGGEFATEEEARLVAEQTGLPFESVRQQFGRKGDFLPLARTRAIKGAHSITSLVSAMSGQETRPPTAGFLGYDPTRVPSGTGQRLGARVAEEFGASALMGPAAAYPVGRAVQAGGRAIPALMREAGIFGSSNVGAGIGAGLLAGEDRPAYEITGGVLGGVVAPTALGKTTKLLTNVGSSILGVRRAMKSDLPSGERLSALRAENPATFDFLKREVGTRASELAERTLQREIKTLIDTNPSILPTIEHNLSRMQRINVDRTARGEPPLQLSLPELAGGNLESLNRMQQLAVSGDLDAAARFQAEQARKQISLQGEARKIVRPSPSKAITRALKEADSQERAVLAARTDDLERDLETLLSRLPDVPQKDVGEALTKITRTSLDTHLSKLKDMFTDTDAKFADSGVTINVSPVVAKAREILSGPNSVFAPEEIPPDVARLIRATTPKPAEAGPVILGADGNPLSIAAEKVDPELGLTDLVAADRALGSHIRNLQVTGAVQRGGTTERTRMRNLISLRRTIDDALKNPVAPDGAAGSEELIGGYRNLKAEYSDAMRKRYGGETGRLLAKSVWGDKLIPDSNVIADVMKNRDNLDNFLNSMGDDGEAMLQLKAGVLNLYRRSAYPGGAAYSKGGSASFLKRYDDSLKRLGVRDDIAGLAGEGRALDGLAREVTLRGEELDASMINGGLATNDASQIVRAALRQKGNLPLMREILTKVKDPQARMAIARESLGDVIENPEITPNALLKHLNENDRALRLVFRSAYGPKGLKHLQRLRDIAEVQKIVLDPKTVNISEKDLAEAGTVQKVMRDLGVPSTQVFAAARAVLRGNAGVVAPSSTYFGGVFAGQMMASLTLEERKAIIRRLIGDPDAFAQYARKSLTPATRDKPSDWLKDILGFAVSGSGRRTVYSVPGTAATSLPPTGKDDEDRESK